MMSTSKQFERSERRPNFGPSSMVPISCNVTCTVSGSRFPAFASLRACRSVADLRLQQVLAVSTSSTSTPPSIRAQRLLFVSSNHLVEADVSERRQLGGRAHRSRDEARPLFCGELLRNFPRQLRGRDVDLATRSARSNSPSTMRVPPKVLVSTTSQPTRKNSAWMSRMMSGRLSTRTSLQFSLPQIIVQRGIAELDVGAHRAVVDDDAFPHGLEKISHI